MKIKFIRNNIVVAWSYLFLLSGVTISSSQNIRSVPEHIKVGHERRHLNEDLFQLLPLEDIDMNGSIIS